MKRADTEILTVDDLARLLACDKETAAARLISGDLPGVKVGRGWIVPRQALFERLNEKAREESEARRAYHIDALETAKLRGQPQSMLVARQPPVALLGATTSKKRGRQRRDPPTLPPIPA